MSQSPVQQADFSDATDENSAYRQGLVNVNRLVKAGGSLSGFERNCAFLNTRDGQFATVSAVSGFDFLDDGRALGVTDWDSDGDLDVWVSNRTAPRVRFLRNETRRGDTSTDRNFVSVRLQGVRCNRDAIGARVILESSDQRPMMKSVRAGEGFLGQSSKVVHFGVGSLSRIERLKIRWPDGSEQVFRDVAVNQHYRIVQDEATLHSWSRPKAELRIQPKAQLKPSRNGPQRIVLGQPLPAPYLLYEDFDAAGDSQRSVGEIAGPVLLNLWASWCGPCLAELAELEKERDSLRGLGLNVVAVAVDEQVADASGEKQSIDAARDLVNRLGLKFATGKATEDLMARIKALHDLAFGAGAKLPVPTSFLLDRERRICVVYRGSIDVDQLRTDVAMLARPPAQQLANSYAQPGYWNAPPPEPKLLRLPLELMDRGEVDDALAFAERYRNELAQNHEFPKLLVWIGDEMVARGNPKLGLQLYQRALELDPKHLLALNNLAWQLATHTDEQVRNGRLAVKYAEQAARQTQARNPGILDTLAAAYAEMGKFETSLKVIDRAILLSQGTDNVQLQQQLQQRRQQFKNRQPVRITSP